LTNLKISKTFFGVIFILLMLLVWQVASPFFEAIVFATIIAGSFYPLFEKLNEKLKNRKVSSSITTIIITILILFPTIFVFSHISKEAIHLYKNFSSALSDNSINTFLFGDGILGSFIKKLAAFFNIEINMAFLKQNIITYIESFSSYIIKFVNSFLSNFISLLFNIFIMIVVLFSLFFYGKDLRKFFLNLSPLPDSENEEVIKQFNQMNYATLTSNGLFGIIQGGLAGIMFWIIGGISSVVLWSLIMVVLAFIPMIGISFIYIPASIYLILKGRVAAGVILFLYCALVAFLVENYFKPKFIGHSMKVNSVFIFLFIFGGISAFGVGGIFYGPIIGLLFLTFANIYNRSYSIK
jgi:predicted PurR-regulated permease PerM